MKKLIDFKGCQDTACNLDGDNGALALCINMLPAHSSLTPMPSLTPDPAAKPCCPASADDYFPDLSDALQLTFGLQKAGSLSIDEKFQVPAYLSSSPGNGQGASSPHPSAAAEVADCQSAAKKICESLNHAISTQVYAKGLIFHPCFLRYALRLSDGSILWVSAPVLMLPNSLPPRLAISSIEAADDGKHSIIGFSPNHNPYFRLRCRVVSPISPALAQKIAGIDIYCTPGVASYDQDNISTLGITDYANVVQESSSSPHRGRTSSDPIIGHWSEANDQYRAHQLSELGAIGTAWHMNPNPSLALSLACEGRYYKIASIPLQDAMSDNGYFDIPLQSTDPKAIEKLPQLAHCPSQLRHKPALKLPVAGHTYFAGGKAELETPQSLHTLVSARHTGEENAQCTIAVMVRTADGTRCALHSINDMPIADLSNDFPRYLYYPHKGTYKMAIFANGRWREMPMMPHPHLDGAYWMGSLDDIDAPAPLADAQGAALAAEIASASNEIPTPNILLCTTNEHIFHIVGSLTVGDGGIISLMPAMKAMSQGQFGQHALYAFCGNGVWAVAPEAASCQQINSDTAVSSDAIAAIGPEICYATPHKVMMLSGCSASCISDDMPGTGGFDPSRLPFWQLITFKAGMPSVYSSIQSLSSLLGDCSIEYDSEHGLLIISKPDYDMAYVYNPAEKAWAMRFSDCCGVVATHPIVLDKHHDPCSVKSSRIVGDYMPGSTSLILYGSNNLWDWRLMANSDSGEAYDLNGERVRYAIAVVLSRGANLKYLTISD